MRKPSRFMDTLIALQAIDRAAGRVSTLDGNHREAAWLQQARLVVHRVMTICELNQHARHVARCPRELEDCPRCQAVLLPPMPSDIAREIMRRAQVLNGLDAPEPQAPFR
jgi:hypothetical protein